MQKILFSTMKRSIAEFNVEVLNFERQAEGFLLSAQGEMVFQDTPSLEELLHAGGNCHVAIIKDGEQVVDQTFQVTFFTLEQDTLVVLLQ